MHAAPQCSVHQCTSSIEVSTLRGCSGSKASCIVTWAPLCRSTWPISGLASSVDWGAETCLTLKIYQWICGNDWDWNWVFIYTYLLSSCIAIRVPKRWHRSFQPDTKCSVWNPTSFYSYNSSVSILGIIFFSILNDDAGMLHSELNCSSSFSRTAKASAKACHIHDKMV
jgi:hypothetical protein